MEEEKPNEINEYGEELWFSGQEPKGLNTPHSWLIVCASDDDAMELYDNGAGKQATARNLSRLEVPSGWIYRLERSTTQPDSDNWVHEQTCLVFVPFPVKPTST